LIIKKEEEKKNKTPQKRNKEIERREPPKCGRSSTLALQVWVSCFSSKGVLQSHASHNLHHNALPIYLTLFLWFQITFC